MIKRKAAIVFAVVALSVTFSATAGSASAVSAPSNQIVRAGSNGGPAPVAGEAKGMNYANVTDVTKYGSTITITLADGKHLTASASLYKLVRNHMLAVRSGKAKLVPAHRAARALEAVRPDNNASAKLCGNCGCSWSYIGYQNTSSYPYLFSTGFSLDDYPAVSYSWVGDVYGPNSYHYHYTSSGGLAERWTWNGSHTAQVKVSGTWEAFVDTTAFAVDTLGGVCTSIGPFDVEGL